MKAKAQAKTEPKRKAPAKSSRQAPAILYRQGKPAFVLLDIRDYRKMLDRLDDLEDIEYIESMRGKPRHYRPLEEILAEHNRK